MLIPLTTTNCSMNKKKFQVAEAFPVSDSYRQQHKIILTEKRMKE